MLVADNPAAAGSPQARSFAAGSQSSAAADIAAAFGNLQRRIGQAQSGKRTTDSASSDCMKVIRLTGTQTQLAAWHETANSARKRQF